MIRKQTLKSGLTLVTESMPHVRSVSIGVWLRRGSRNEPERVNGISHFIEHLVFKGTRNRTAREIALVMDAVGGQMDAFTSKEYTCFYAKVLDQHLDAAIDLLADIVQRPLFDPTELERERNVVLEEIRMVEDTPDEMIYDLFSTHFFPGQTLGRPIQGTVETVSALTRRQLLGFFRRAYHPQNMLIVAAGSLKHARVARLVTRAFSELVPGAAAATRPARARPVSGVLTRVEKDLEQMHLLLGLPAFPESFDGRYPLHVLNTILGSAMSSRLFQRIREQRGLAYSVYSALQAFADTGFLIVSAATSPDNANEVVRLVVEELGRMRDEPPTEEEVEVAREHLKGSIMLSLESTSSRMSNLARQEFYFGREVGLSETLRGIGRVDARAVHELAGRLFGSRRLALAAVGKVGRLSIEPGELVL